MKYFTLLFFTVLLSCVEEAPEILESNELIIVTSSFEDYEKLTIGISLQCPGCFLETEEIVKIQVFDQESANTVHEAEYSFSLWRCIDNIQGSLSLVLSSDNVPPAGLYEIVVSIGLIQNNCTGDISAVGKHMFRYLL